ncbi:MAG: hypothetical protein FJ146_04975 [Deltaproteobacteria bacterium]|nr:hypothetical protein [Deltaproteobacteria bacterium]
MSLKLSYPAVIAFISIAFTANLARAETLSLPVVEVTTLAKAVGDPRAKSLESRDISLISVRAHAPRQHTPTRVLIEGGLHGNETATTEFVQWITRRLARGEGPLIPFLTNGVQFDLLPAANPDGGVQGQRSNSRGVNLNRNFGVLWGLSRENPGSASFSEPETRAIRKLFQNRSYTVAIDVHGYINWVVTPSAPSQLKATGYEPNQAKLAAYAGWRQALLAQSVLLPGYEVKTGAELGDGGAFEDWAFWGQGTLAYCLEIEDPDAVTTTQTAREELFKRYERFIAKSVKAAVVIARESGLTTTLAAKQGR